MMIICDMLLARDITDCKFSFVDGALVINHNGKKTNIKVSGPKELITFIDNTKNGLLPVPDYKLLQKDGYINALNSHFWEEDGYSYVKYYNYNELNKLFERMKDF